MNKCRVYKIKLAEIKEISKLEACLDDEELGCFFITYRDNSKDKITALYHAAKEYREIILKAFYEYDNIC